MRAVAAASTSTIDGALLLQQCRSSARLERVALRSLRNHRRHPRAAARAGCRRRSPRRPHRVERPRRRASVRSPAHVRRAGHHVPAITRSASAASATVVANRADLHPETTRRRAGQARDAARSASRPTRRRARRAGRIDSRPYRTRSAAAPSAPPRRRPSRRSIPRAGVPIDADGFRVGHNAESRVDEPIANSSQLVFPTTTAPAAMSRSTAVAFTGGCSARQDRRDAAVACQAARAEVVLERAIRTPTSGSPSTVAPPVEGRGPSRPRPAIAANGLHRRIDRGDTATSAARPGDRRRLADIAPRGRSHPRSRTVVSPKTRGTSKSPCGRSCVGRLRDGLWPAATAAGHRRATRWRRRRVRGRRARRWSRPAAPRRRRRREARQLRREEVLLVLQPVRVRRPRAPIPARRPRA